MEPFPLVFWPETENSPVKDQLISHVAIDSRSVQPKKSLFFALLGTHSDGHNYVEAALSSNAVAAVVQKKYNAPGSVPEERLIRVESPLKALQNLAACYRKSLLGCTLIAVCGSCGKTMLKDLLKELFTHKDAYCSPESFNSQIGVPLSVLNIPKTAKYAFIEMAATREGEMHRLAAITQPNMAIVTNFLKRRLGTESLQTTIANEISSLLHILPKDGLAIIETNPTIDTASIPCPILFWDAPPSSYPTIKHHKILSHRHLELHCSFPDNTTQHLTVQTDYSNSIDLFLSALATAHSCNLQKEEIIAAFHRYTPQAMRTEVWKNPSQVTFINGTYCHSRLSLEASFREIEPFSTSAKKYLLFGGLPHESEYAYLHQILSKHNVCEVFAWPERTATLLKQQTLIPITSNTTIEEAIQSAKNTVGPKDTLIIKAPHKIPYEWVMEQFDDSPPHTIAKIKLAAIRYNLDLIRSILPPKTRIMVMVKALAYGTDDIRMSTFLKSCGVDILGVSYVDEGAHMRKMGITQDIFVINASEKEIHKAALYNLQIGISSPEQIDSARSVAQKLHLKIKIHLHVDTGMNRFGCRPENALLLAQHITQSPLLELEGLFTHLSVADEPSQDDFTRHQQSIFSNVIASLHSHNIFPRYCHASNSAAALRMNSPLFNMVRIGIATYGYQASSQTCNSIRLQPSLSLSTHIAGFNDTFKGESVSYGRTYIIPQEKARLAILPIGYYDGLHRAYSSKSHVLIRGKRAPMVGRICMDYMMVDVTNIPEASIGDPALLFGEDDIGNYRSPEALASDGGSIVHELLTCLGPRIQRLFIYDESL